MPDIADDKPIESATQDTLGRGPLVQDVVRQIEAAGAISGYVVGLMGPWGYGKTSVLNLVANELQATQKFTVIRFNPWLFAGSSELVGQFLAEFAAQLRADLKDRVASLCDLIEEYSSIIAPATLAAAAVSGPAAFFVAVLAALRAQRSAQKERFENSVLKKKMKVEQELKTLGRRIVVMIDDLDRLSDAEIKDVMRMVRLVGDFPNTTYVLAFDRERVTKALASDGGHAYIDKIVQAPYDLPVLEQQALNTYLTTQLDGILSEMKTGPFVREDWDNVFLTGIFPLLKTPRDAKRLSNALQMALRGVGDEVSVVDLIAIEAIRLFVPDVFAQIKKHRKLVTDISERTARRGESEDAQRFAEITGAAGEDRRPVTEILRRTFPATRRFIDNTVSGPDALKRWRRDRRLAHHEILAYYLERLFPRSVLAPSKVGALFDASSDEVALGRLLDELDPTLLESAIGRLEDYEDVFKPEMAEPAAFAVLSRATRLRKGRDYMWDMGAGLAVRRLILRLLRSVKTPQEVAEITGRLLGRIDSLSWCLDLVIVVGHHESAGHKLVTVEAASDLERSFRDKIKNTATETLLGEQALWQILYFLKGGATEDQERVVALCNEDRVFFALLKAGLTKTFSQTAGEVAQRVKVRLQWKGLEMLMDPETLKQRVLALDPARLPVDDDLKTAVELATKYAKGELHPDAFGDD